MAFSKQDLKAFRANKLRTDKRTKESPKFSIDPYTQIFIEGEARPMKNSKRIFCKDENGNPLDRPRVLPSLNCEKYIQHVAPQLIKLHPRWEMLIKGKKPPYHILFQFIRKDRSRFDYSNLIEVLQDCMTLSAYKKKTMLPKGLSMSMIAPYAWLKDDDSKNLVPYFAPVIIDKIKQGTIIRVLPGPPDYGLNIW